jgi:hypothetical protein
MTGVEVHAKGWHIRKLTEGTAAAIFHSHSYYDLPVLDSQERQVVAFRVRFAGHPPAPTDSVDVGVIDLTDQDGFRAVGTSRAWSWQQGPMAQWLPGSNRIVWNDREGEHFVARVHDMDTGEAAMLERPIYAVDSGGSVALSLNFSRLQGLRPGYGYPGGGDEHAEHPSPTEDGIWRLDLETGGSRIVLSLERAVDVLSAWASRGRRVVHALRPYRYWFNHLKIDPSGQRFTVKLRFRVPGGRWSDAQGVSLTCGVDGADCRVLTDRTSHVLWWSEDDLYLWRRDGVYVYRDDSGGGRRRSRLAPELLTHNVHARHVPESPHRFVYDTPYRETVELYACDHRDPASRVHLASFQNHRPRSGPFRCDLHPVPNRSGDRILVTSLADGGRQLYLLERR